MELRIVMADPAGNRTAIVRTPVPAAFRAQTAARIMEIEELRAEQVAFEVSPQLGGAGRIEMMGGEFCGNAARSYGYLLCTERAEKAGIQAETIDGEAQRIDKKAGRIDKKADNAGVDAEKTGRKAEKAGIEAKNHGRKTETDRAEAENPATKEKIAIEISGHTGLLKVDCALPDPEDAANKKNSPDAREGGTILQGVSYAEMPVPGRLDYSAEGYPLVISEGITHMILENMDPDPSLVRRYVKRYGSGFDAFGMMFLRGDILVPVVYVEAAGTLVYESSCGSGSLAAAWYLAQKKLKQMQKLKPNRQGTNRKDQDPENGSDLTVKAAEQKTGSTTATGNTVRYTFREPGGSITVRLQTGQDGKLHGSMGGLVQLEEEILLHL